MFCFHPDVRDATMGPVSWVHVLQEDARLLVVHKPAGLVCHPTKGDAASSLIGRVRLHLGAEEEPQMVHRLDRETSGVMVFGKTTEASALLRQAWAQGWVTKEYLALVHGHPVEDEGFIEARIGRDETSEIAIRDRVRPDGATARTRYRVIRRFERREGRFSLIRVWLDTGRKHQIRIHLAHVGHPLVGDKLYGPDPGLYLAFVQRRLTVEQKARLMLPSHGLHAARLWLPWEGEERGFGSEPERTFRNFVEGREVEWLEDPFDPQRPTGPIAGPGA
jgi:23S rRNA pseudouridine1911/1915/1917 synthase